jgi:hypothetical protein
VTERGLPLADGAPACPFVAFEDDRDERASVPDHRHRCYADQRPAPRALAHQEAYCLSSAFPVCPTFQDWARREAARSRDGAPTAPSASAGMNRAASGAAGADAGSSASAAALGTAGSTGAAASASQAASAGSGGTAPSGSAPDALVGGSGEGDDRAAQDSFDPAEADDRSVDDAHDPHGDDSARRNPPRDWAAPPPWLASSEARRGGDADPPAFLGRRVSEPGQGLAGSPADRMAGGPPPAQRGAVDDGVWSSESRSAAALGAGLASGGAGASAAGPAAAGRRQGTDDEPFDHDDQGDHDHEPGDEARPIARRPRAYAQHLGGPDGPDWERPRRYEAYPVIKTRVAMPAIPRTLGLFGLVIVVAIALLLLPSLLNLGGTASPGGSAGASQRSAASASLAPTEVPAATPIVYTIKQNDTLLKIAKAHGITIEALRAANPTIKDPNKISVGQVITIPTPSEPPPDTIQASPSQ